MSSTTAAPASTPTAAPAPRATLRRARLWLLWGAILASGVLLLALLMGGAPPPATVAEPESNRPEGALAIVRVLSDQGVQIDTVRSIGELEDSDLEGATVLVSSMARMTPEVVNRTLQASEGSARVVLLLPTAEQLSRSELPVSRRIDFTAAGQPARCEEDFVRAGELVGNWTARYDSTDPQWRQCFVGTRGAGVLLGPGPGGSQIVIVGSQTFLTNDKILANDASALAVRLLGSTDRLIWYHSGIIDLTQADADTPSGFQLPQWFTPLVVLLGSAVLLLGVVLGRRLGRVVIEPLPVVVRAIETTTARGLLYRRANEPGRSAGILRDATRHRLGARFGLSASTDQDGLTNAVAGASGVPAARVHDLLWGPDVHTDTALVDLAHALTDLEEKVRQP